MVLRLALLLAATFAASTRAHEIETVASPGNPPRMEFTVENGEHANLVYHAICFAERISCTSEAFQRLWKGTLGWSADDARMMRAFESALTFKSVPPKGVYPFPPNYPAFYESERRERGLIAALLDAHDLADARSRAESLAGSKRAAAIDAMLRAMQPRFHQWWRNTGEARSLGYARNITTVMRDNQLVDLSERVARGMGFDWQGTQRLRFHIIAHPDAEPHAARATQILQQAVLEATTALPTEAWVSISLHELFHYFYESLPLERHVELMRAFAASDEPFAGAYYTYANEALVSSLAALVDKRLNPATYEEKSTNLNYSHPFIAPLARALYTITPARLEQGRNLLEGIVPEYIAAGKRELGPNATTLSFALASRGIVGRDALIKEVLPALREASPGIGNFTNETKLLRHFENANILRLRIARGKPRFDLRHPTAKSVDITLTAPDTGSLTKLIREKLSAATTTAAR